MSDRTEAVRHILATVFAAQNALRALAPEYRWTGLGNLLGDYGEFLAIDHYGLTKAGAGSSGYDAITPDGKTVQIKTNHAFGPSGSEVRQTAPRLKVQTDGTWEELYYGDFQSVIAIANGPRDSKHSSMCSPANGGVFFRVSGRPNLERSSPPLLTVLLLLTGENQEEGDGARTRTDPGVGHPEVFFGVPDPMECVGGSVGGKSDRFEKEVLSVRTSFWT